MKKRVCCLLMILCMLCLPAQQAFAVPAGPGPAEKAEKDLAEKPLPPHAKKPHEKPLPPHLKKPHEKPVPPHEKPLLPHEKPVPPHEQELHEKPLPKPLPDKEDTDITKPLPTSTPTNKPTSIPTAKPTAKPTSVPVEEDEEKDNDDTTAGMEIVKFATKFLGNPYVYGGTSLTKGADCSGFVQSVYAHFNYSLPRTSRSQASSAGYMDVALKESELQPGDLIFYDDGTGIVCHVAIYMGDGKIVHAAGVKLGITISEYTYRKPCKARRVIQ